MNRPNVLLVDDEAIVRDSISEWLKGDGYKVECASGGSEALGVIKDRKFDAAVIDLKMPGMSGLELMKHIKQGYPLVRVIIITAYGTVENAVDALKGGASDYITKPFTPERLEKAIDEPARPSAEAAEVIAPPVSEVVAPAEKQCVWSKMGAVSYRVCTTNFKCEACEFGQTLMDKGEAAGDRPMMEGVIEKLLARPGCERQCRYMLSGDVDYKLCPNLYQCHHCSFDQQMQERIDAKTEAMLARLKERKARAH